MTPDQIREQLALAAHKKEDAQATLDLILPSIEYLRMRKEALRAEMQALVTSLEEKEDYARKWDQAIYDANTDIERLQRELQRALAEQAAQRALIEMESIFDEVIADAPWRDLIKPHQLEGARRMAAMRRGILADKRGLGKTLTGYAWADMLKSRRLLVMAPRKSAVNLKNELARWAPHRQLFYLVGVPKAQRDMVLSHIAQIADVIPQFTIIVNLEAWRRDSDLLDHLKKMMFDTVIIDEAHKVKESTTSMFQGARDIIYFKNQCPSCGKFSMPMKVQLVNQLYCPSCDFRVGYEDRNEFCSVKNVLLTGGSPIKNRPGEIWSQLHLLDQEGFPSMAAFKTDYLRFDYFKSEWTWRPGGEESLVRKLGMRYLCRTEKDAGIVRLPVGNQTVEVEFSRAGHPLQWKEYWKIQDEFEATLESGATIQMTSVIAQFTRLQQAALWPPSIKIYGQEWDENTQRMKSTRVVVDRVYAAESAIIDSSVELIRELVEEGNRIVVFSKFKEQYNEMYARLTEANSSIRPIRLTGDTSQEALDLIMRDFDQRTYNEDPEYTSKWDVILTTYSAGGESLNFTAANQVILLEPAYNPENESQAIGRVDRMGQLGSVTVHKMSLSTGEGGRATAYQWLEGINQRKTRMLAGFEEEISLAEMIIQEVRRSHR